MTFQFDRLFNCFFQKLFLAAAFAALGVSMVSAQKIDRRSLVEKIQINRTDVSLSAAKLGVTPASPAQIAHSRNFKIGKGFSLVLFDAAGLDSEKDALNYTIVDLVYLIDALGTQPEAAVLQKTLQAVVRDQANAEQVASLVENAAKTYAARQNSGEKWYFAAGQTSMKLMIAGFLNDGANAQKMLAQVQILIKTAPAGTAKEILEPMNELAGLAVKPIFNEADFTQICGGVTTLTSAIIV